MTQFQMAPGAYGDFISLDETEITLGRAPGSFGQPIDLESSILRRQDQLLGRGIDRLRQIGWALVSQGVFSVPTPDGQIVHTDAYNVKSYVSKKP